MPRDAIPLSTPDAAAFARRLAKALAEDPHPSHLRLLNHLARAAGHSSWQGLRAASTRPGPVLPPLEVEADLDRVVRAARAFDAEGRMARWPNRTVLQGLCLWVMWARMPARRDLSEREVNEVLKAHSTFGDHVLLRRSLIDHRLAERSPDGRIYRRIEKAPPPEAAALIARVPRP
jgi:hypothetical protein